MRKLIGRRVAIVVCDGFELADLVEPRTALEDEGAETEIVSPAGRTVKSWKVSDWARPMKVDVPLDLAKVGDYDALLLPGGAMNLDKLRLHPRAIALIREFAMSGKPIAAVSHGPWPLIDAGLVHGKRLTSWPSLRTDLRNAGATWVDQPVVVDGLLITSRKAADLAAFARETIHLIAQKALHTRATVLRAN